MLLNRLNKENRLRSIGARLAIVRGEARLTQATFAESIGLSPRAYHYYEKGQRSMPLESLDQVASLYEVDLNWLVSGLDKGDLSDVSKEIEQFAEDLYIYLNESGAKMRTESFKAIVGRWYQAVRDGKEVTAEDVQIWVDIVRTN